MKTMKEIMITGFMILIWKINKFAQLRLYEYRKEIKMKLNQELIGAKIKFPQNNKIGYTQDFGWHEGLPSDIEFEICGDFGGSKLNLKAPEYGVEPYGNGKIALYFFEEEKIQTGTNELEELKHEIMLLKKQIEELQQRPQYIPYPIYPQQPINPWPYNPPFNWTSSEQAREEALKIANIINDYNK